MAIKFVPVVRKLKYRERIATVNLSTMKENREKGDKITTSKFLYQSVSVDKELFFRTNRVRSAKGRNLKPSEKKKLYE